MLLTLLAILTGLSWQGGNVSARTMAAPAQVSALATVKQAKASAVLARPVAARSGAGLPLPELASAVPVSAPAPAVRTRIDRARE
jgi:hypothetical protein